MRMMHAEDLCHLTLIKLMGADRSKKDAPLGDIQAQDIPNLIYAFKRFYGNCFPQNSPISFSFDRINLNYDSRLFRGKREKTSILPFKYPDEKYYNPPHKPYFILASGQEIDSNGQQVEPPIKPTPQDKILVVVKDKAGSKEIKKQKNRPNPNRLIIYRP